jgi:hypothetical protein
VPRPVAARKPRGSTETCGPSEAGTAEKPGSARSRLRRRLPARPKTPEGPGQAARKKVVKKPAKKAKVPAKKARRPRAERSAASSTAPPKVIAPRKEHYDTVVVMARRGTPVKSLPGILSN